MEKSAALIPMNLNVKLIIRHSFRPTLQGTLKHQDVRLTSEGISLASSFGDSIDYVIGELHSSSIPRCIETIESIMANRCENHKINCSSEVLTDVFAIDRELANQSFKTIGSLKEIVFLQQEKRCPMGFRNRDDCVKLLLDYIFHTGGELGKLDLYCTHDLQIALLNSALFSPHASLEEIKSIWPNMLEGMFFWGCREDFCCVWRGKSQRFLNFML